MRAMHFTSSSGIVVGCALATEEAEEEEDSRRDDFGVGNGRLSAARKGVEADLTESFSLPSNPNCFSLWERGACLLSYLRRGLRSCRLPGCHFVQSYAPSARGSPTAGKKSWA